MLYIGIHCDVISRWELFQKMGKTFFKLSTIYVTYNYSWCRRDRDRMVVRFTTTCAISAYHH